MTEGLAIGADDFDAASNSAEVIDMASRSPAEGGVIPAGRVFDLARWCFGFRNGESLFAEEEAEEECAGSKAAKSDRSRESPEEAKVGGLPLMAAVAVAAATAAASRNS